MLNSSALPPLRDELHMKIALCRPRNLSRLIDTIWGQELACLGRVRDLERVSEIDTGGLQGMATTDAGPRPGDGDRAVEGADRVAEELPGMLEERLEDSRRSQREAHRRVISRRPSPSRVLAR